MSVAVKIPEVGESISEVAIGEWLKHEGDFVERDEDVVVIETDKATVEVPAPEAGRVVKILKNAGDTASVNEIIAYIDNSQSNDAAKASAQPNNRSDQSEPAPRKTAGTKKDESAPQPALTPEPAKPDGEDQKVQRSETSDQESPSATKEISEEAGILDSLQEPKDQDADGKTSAATGGSSGCETPNSGAARRELTTAPAPERRANLAAGCRTSRRDSADESVAPQNCRATGPGATNGRSTYDVQ